MTKNDFTACLAANGLSVYEASVDEAQGTLAAIVRRDLVKYLAAAGEKAACFAGEEAGGFRLCPLNNENALVLQALFPYTKPSGHREHRFTMGFGDRLGIAAPGHIRAVRGTGVFPVLAQQSIRELDLTGRTFQDVISAAAFHVFQEGYRDGYGADGDHLKTKEEIRYALESGCTMITLDCSEHIRQQAAAWPQEQIEAAYRSLPEEMRIHYETVYAGRDLPVVGGINEADLRRIAVVFGGAVAHAVDCFRYIGRVRTAEVDEELSIDETLTATTPAEHFVIGHELRLAGITPVSCAPHFSGSFEKGIEYAGDLNAFARDLAIHQKIADHFGYKLSLHSGSDKFSVFSAVGRITGGRVHVKTAGTSWLEALRVLAQADPDLYRRAHKYALEHRGEAERYYHVSTDVREIPDIDLQNDAYLPEYLTLPASRQTMHIAYGLLLRQPWFKEEFGRVMAGHEEDYKAALARHLGKHIRILTGGIG